MEQVTIEQVLRVNIGALSNLKVPVGLFNEIGIPIARTIEDLKVCVAALQKAQESKPKEPSVEQNESLESDIEISEPELVSAKEVPEDAEILEG